MASKGAVNSQREERLPKALKVNLDHVTGITRNISASGVFFEVDADYAEGSEISFAIELDAEEGRKWVLQCTGKIVRVERKDGGIGVATKIIRSKLESVDQANNNANFRLIF